MMKRLSLLTVVFSIAVASVVFPMHVLAQPTATATLDPASNCSFGELQLVITGTSGGRELVRATTSTGTILSDDEHASIAGTSYTGPYMFSFNSPVPNGTIVTLYGYLGSTPPTPSTTAEFSITYRCDTHQVLASCAGPFGPCSEGPGFPALDGLWFKMNAVVKGYNVNKANGDMVPHNFTVPLYMGFAWDEVNSQYDVRLFTQTAPGVWTNTYSTTEGPITYTQNFLSDFYVQVWPNATDWIATYHTPYIKYVLDNMGAVKKATYSGTGEVHDGSFDAGASTCYGNVKISGTTVSVSTLPFTP